jgi:hypothetical protein
LKHSIALVDLELGDVKESVEFSKEYMTDLSIEIEDQKDLIIHEIHSEMDRDYRDLKKYVRRNMNKHLLEEHPEDDECDEDEVNVADEAVVDCIDKVKIDIETAVTSVSTGEVTDVTRDEVNNEDTVIIMDDADFNSTDDEE